MASVRPVFPVSPSASPLPSGYRLTLPAEVHFGQGGRRVTPAVPSKNGSKRENIHVYAGRRDGLAAMLRILLVASGAPRLYRRIRMVRRGNAMGHEDERCAFHHARLTWTVYHRTAHASRYGDRHNYHGGGEALYDALQLSGWVLDDRHLTIDLPVLAVDRAAPRVVLDLVAVSQGEETPTDAGVQE